MARWGVPGERQQAQQGRLLPEPSPARRTPTSLQRGNIISGTGGNARHAVWREGGTHSGQGLLDVFSGSRDVTEDHAGAVLLQMVQKKQLIKKKKKKKI